MPEITLSNLVTRDFDFIVSEWPQFNLIFLLVTAYRWGRFDHRSEDDFYCLKGLQVISLPDILL